MIPLTYAQAKLRLARCFAGDQGVSDARVLDYTNYAQAAIIRDLAGIGPDGKPWTPRGVYVGGVDPLSLTISAQGTFDLPSTHETALEIEVFSATDINNGWLSDLSPMGSVDPDFVNDLVFLDQGLVSGTNQRRYLVPDSTQWNQQARVVAKKRFVPVVQDTDYLVVPNVEAVAAMLISLRKAEVRDGAKDAEDYRTRALRSMQSEFFGYLQDSTRVAARKAAYLNDEKTYAEGTLGNTRAFLALNLPAGLKVGKSNLTRGINEAVKEAVQFRNSISATELYSNQDGPDILTYVKAVLPTDVLSYGDVETLRLLCMAQATPENADALRQQAFALIERDRAKAVTAVRHQKWQCLLKLPEYSFGKVRGTIGLGLSEAGYQLSDGKLARMVNEVEESLSHTPNFVGAEETYQLGCIDGLVEMPDDVERIIWADICGWPVDVKHRSFEYIPYPQGNGVHGNCRYDGAWSYFGATGLQDRGLNEDGNRTYFVSNCFHGALRVVVKRRWKRKVSDREPMLIRDLNTLRTRVEAMMARQKGDLASAAALETAADTYLDRQLEDHVGSATLVPNVSFAGSRRGGAPRLARRFFGR